MDEDFSPDASEFRCLVPFPDGSDSFTHGFEAGMVWQRMISGEAMIGGDTEVATHRENEEVFRRMADAYGYLVEIDESDCGWMIALFTKNPKRFRVV